MRADEKLTAFLELQKAIHAFAVDLGVKLHPSLNSPLCSCVSITLSASSNFFSWDTARRMRAHEALVMGMKEGQGILIVDELSGASLSGGL